MAQGIPMLIGVIFFAFQLYLDFSAYSNIAIGVAKILGFDLSTNFRNPYLAKSFSDFWSRWHISLSSWFRDYLYIPLGGNVNGRGKKNRNILIVFLLSGLWHGASWNFVLWGVLNGFFLILFDKLLKRKKEVLFLPTFFVVSCWALSLVFFRANSLEEVFLVFSNIGLSNTDLLYEFGLNEFKLSIWLLFGVLFMGFLQEKKVDFFGWISTLNVFFRYFFYVSMVLFIVVYGSCGAGVNDNNFIYFQF